MNKKHESVLEYLKNYSDKKAARFHMPGHKGFSVFKKSLEKDLEENSEEDFYSMDITEISGADNLLNPTGILKYAQDCSAHFFGARSTFFSTCGASAAIAAAILAVPRDCTILAARDCHKSVVSAIALSGHESELMHLEYDKEREINKVIDVSLIRKKVKSLEFIDNLAIVITRPDYYGRCADIINISNYCDEMGAILIVDEAHGAHFNFSEDLPTTAADYADIWINSAHKTLEVPNQGAYIHLGNKSNKISLNDIESKLALVHTTSPSYPIMAALDCAWRDKNQEWQQHIDNIKAWRADLPVFWRSALENSGLEGIDADITRLCFDVGGYDARAIATELEDAGIYLEMCDHRRLVAITTPCDDAAWYDRLSAALKKAKLTKRDTTDIYAFDRSPKKVLSIREALFSRCERMNIVDAAGRVSASSVGLYPPGSAIIAPGEVIERDIVDYLIKQKNSGAEIFGEHAMIVIE